MKSVKNIEYKIGQLTPELIEELNLFLDFLLKKKSKKEHGKLKQDWAGGLKDINMGSVELQKKGLDWRQK